MKNAHLSRKAGLAEFPDSVTERGVKHLQELTAMVAAGHRAVMVYLVQRSDAKRLAFAEDIDKAYVAALRTAMAAGVEAVALACRISPEEIAVARKIPLKV